MNFRTLLSQFRLLIWKQRSYAQTGEDTLLEIFFQSVNLPLQSYLEIGGCHPVYLSNSYKFYRKGARGVIIEPQPFLAKLYQFWRRGDTVLNIGIGPKASDNLTFYEINPLTLSTFEKDEAETMFRNGTAKSVKERIIPVQTVTDILDKYFSKTVPSFVTLDVEGGELPILKTWPWETHRPLCFVLETLDFNTSQPKPELFEILQKNGYVVWADTRINTLFVDATNLHIKKKLNLS